MSSRVAATRKPALTSPASQPASVAATIGRDAIACAKLTTSRPSIAPRRVSEKKASGSIARRSASALAAPGEDVVERDGARRRDVLRGDLHAARGELAQRPLLVGGEEDVAHPLGAARAVVQP